MSAHWEDDYEMPKEYDLTKVQWVPNPFLQNFRELNLVSLDTDVKAAFPDSQSVNDALRDLLKQSAAHRHDVEAA